MIKLESTPAALDAVPLGKILEIRILKDPAVETRVFLQHRPVFYTRPLADWTTEPRLLVFPEAPGSYILLVEWRSPEGAKGWTELEFVMVASRPSTPEPCKATLDGVTELWLPNAWEKRVFESADQAMMPALETIVKPGAVVYDLGANLGIYSCHMARLIGPEGRLYSIEANPICVHFLRANVMNQGLENVVILPVAVLDHTGETCFTLNYGNSNIGLSESSSFYGVKAGHEIRVPCFELDRLIEEYHLPMPDVVKIDVEGAEHLVIQGMSRLLDERRPALALEIHGEDCGRATLEALDRFGYRYLVPGSREEISPAAIHERYPGHVVYHLLGLPPAS